MARMKRAVDSAPAMRIPPHGHCVVCGKAVPEGEKFCSDECEATFKKMQRAKFMQIIYMLILVFILLLFLYGSA